MSCYHHLTTFDRARIETMTHLGMSLRQIAKNLGEKSFYDFSGNDAEMRTGRRLINRRTPMRWPKKEEGNRNHMDGCLKLAEFITNKLDRTWSLSRLSDGVFLGRFPLKRFIGGSIKGVYNGQRLCCVVKGKAKNPMKPGGASPLVLRLSRGLKRSENERHLAIGN